jgi:hypothetical protein
MPSKFIIKGSLVWIIPIFIILATSSFILYALYPAVEHFTSEEKDISLKLKEDSNKKKIKDKKELYYLKKKLKELKKKIEIESEIERESESENEIKNEIKNISKNSVSKKNDIKENFETYSNTSEILRKNWRKEDLPKTLKKYNGSIQGYNCGAYSEFTLSSSESCVPFEEHKKEYKNSSSDKGNSIFPGKSINKTNCIKYASQPNILGYENDVNKKILEYESSNILHDYNLSKNMSNFDRPQFMYHRRDGTDDPIITDSNRFEVGKINTFQRKIRDYSIE